MAVGQTTWPEPVKAACISAAMGGMVAEEVSSIYGVPERTVRHWLQYPPKALNLQQVAEHQKTLDAKSEVVAHMLVDAAPGKIEEASLTSVMTSFGIAVDKMRLLREQSTSITATDTEQSKTRAAEILAEAIQLLMKQRQVPQQVIEAEGSTVEGEFLPDTETP